MTGVRGSLLVGIGCAALVLGGGAIALARASHATPSERGASAGAPDTIRANVPAVIPVEPLIVQVRGWTLINTRIDRLESKLVKWGDYLAGAKQYLDAGADPSKVVWLIAVGGEVHPDTGQGRQFGWSVYAFDAATGRTLSTNAGPEHWPPYFDRLAIVYQ